MTGGPRRLGYVSGYASEGGLDGPFQPATVWSALIGLGRAQGPGPADDLWNRYDDLWEFVGELGLDGVRLGIPWARLQPRARVRDDEVLEAYRRVVSRAHHRDLWVSVELVDGAWPSWLGLEPWTMPWVRDALFQYVRWVSAEVGANDYLLVGDIDELTDGFLSGTRPPWRRSARADHDVAERNLREWTGEIRAKLPAVVWACGHDQVVGRLLEGYGPLSGVPALITRSRWAS
ncbi:MAG: hypothetical protein HKL87_01620 [Acidimicrobiaceae bacterium]|nr:hypothetical protein [Acidimicrobiaceae bacterium]